MSQPLIVSNSIAINASPEVVWDTLVNPQKTKIYMFGCEAISGWKPGDELNWVGVFDGQELVAVKGRDVSIDPPRQLVYTTFDPNNPNLEDIPGNYLTVTYDLETKDGETILTASQGDFSQVGNGDARYKEVCNEGIGWSPILVQIKAIAEG